MQELGIELIHAHSSQAKGRIERLWDTLQNRLITEFKVNNIITMEKANEFLKDYVKKFNIKFGVEAVNEKTCFVPVQKNINLDILLSVKYDRTVDKCACFSLNNILFKINNINILPRKKVKILISKKIGVMAEYKGFLYTTTPILDKDKRDINSTESVNMIISQFVYLYCLKSERIS